MQQHDPWDTHEQALRALQPDRPVDIDTAALEILQGGKSQASGGPATLDWRSRLILNRDGTPKAILANAITALRDAPEWTDVLTFDEFASVVSALRPPPWRGKTGQWADQDDRKTTEWLQHQGILVSVDVAGHAAQTVAMERPFHPVRDYIESLRWDGTKRLDTWLSLYLGVEHSEYVRAVGSGWLIQAVARILQPGVKADCILVLEGKQGLGKSTAMRTLLAPWFCDHLPDLSNKDAFLHLTGKWCVELAELAGISKAEASRVKAFLSSPIDRYRLPYGRRTMDVPRQTVFCGTINHSEYLKDETGNRRFWPVRCEKIRVDDLARDRDQIWSEAVVRFRSGGRWWLDTPELVRAAENEQARRYEGDAWDGLISPWLAGRDTCSIPEILTQCIAKPKDQWTQPDMNRVARSLRALGWERYQLRTGDDREWRYQRVEN